MLIDLHNKIHNPKSREAPQFAKLSLNANTTGWVVTVFPYSLTHTPF